MYHGQHAAYEAMDLAAFPLQHGAYDPQGAIGPSHLSHPSTSAEPAPTHRPSSKRRSIASRRLTLNAPVPPARTSSLVEPAPSAPLVDSGVPSVQVIQPTPTKNKKKKHGRQAEETSPTLRSYQFAGAGSHGGLEAHHLGMQDESDAELSTAGTPMLGGEDTLDGLSIGMDYNSEEEQARDQEEARRARAREKGRERQRRKRERDKLKAAAEGPKSANRDGLTVLTTSASLTLTGRSPSNPNLFSHPAAHAGPSSASTSYSPLPYSASFPSLSPGDFLSTGSTSVSGQSSPNAFFSPSITTPGVVGSYADATPTAWDPASSSTSLLEMGHAGGNKRSSRPRRGRANSTAGSVPNRRISPAALPVFQPLAHQAEALTSDSKAASQRSSKRRKSEPEPEGFSRSLHTAQTQAQAHGQGHTPVGLGVSLPSEIDIQSAPTTALPSTVTSPSGFHASISPLTHAPWAMINPSHPPTGGFGVSSSQPLPGQAPFYIPIQQEHMSAQPTRPRPRRAASDSTSFVLSDHRHTGVSTPEAVFSTSGPTSAGWSSPPTPPPVPGLPKQYQHPSPVPFTFTSAGQTSTRTVTGNDAGKADAQQQLEHNFSLGPALPSVPHRMTRVQSISGGLRFASLILSLCSDPSVRNVLQSELGMSQEDLPGLQGDLSDVYDRWVASRALQTPAQLTHAEQMTGISGTLERGMSQVSLEGQGQGMRSKAQSTTTSPPSATTATSLSQLPSVPGSPTQGAQPLGDPESFFTPAKQQGLRRQPQTMPSAPAYGAYAQPYIPLQSQDNSQTYDYPQSLEEEAPPTASSLETQPMTASAAGPVQINTSSTAPSATKGKVVKGGKKTHGRNRSLSSNSLLSRGLVINSQTPWPYPPPFATTAMQTGAPPDTPQDGGRSSTVSPSTVQTPSTGNATGRSFAEMQMTAGSHGLGHERGQTGETPAGGGPDVEMDHSSWLATQHQAPRFGSATEPTHLNRSYTQPNLMSIAGPFGEYGSMDMTTGLLPHQGTLDLEASGIDASTGRTEQSHSVGLDSPLNMTRAAAPFKAASSGKDADMRPPTAHIHQPQPYAQAHVYGHPHAHGMVYTTPSQRPARQMQPFTPPTPMPVRGQANMLRHAHGMSMDTSGHPGLYFGHPADQSGQSTQSTGQGPQEVHNQTTDVQPSAGQGDPGMEVDMRWLEGQSA